MGTQGKRLNICSNICRRSCGWELQNIFKASAAVEMIFKCCDIDSGLFEILESGALFGKMLLARIVENDKIEIT